MKLIPAQAVRPVAVLTTVAAAIAVAVAACGGSAITYEATQGTVLSNVTVVNTADGSLQANMAVVVDQGKIVHVAPDRTVHASGTAQLIDTTGKFIIPGLNDMHTHAMVHVDEKISYFPLMIANGITGFREMGAFVGQYPNMVARAHQLNADAQAGKLDAPEALLVPSDIYQAVTSPASAIQSVDQQKVLGVDFIKVISANRDSMLAFLSEAKAQGTYVSGHLTPAVSAAESSQLGWRTIEHLGSNMGILLDCSSDETAMRASIVSAAGTGAPAFPSDGASVQHVLDTYSADKCNALARTFIQNGTWNVPTLRRVRALDETDDAFFLNDPNMVYVDAARTALWTQLQANFAKLPAATKASLKQMYSQQQAVTKLMKQAGVKMMAGSDAGQASVWVIPGISLHQEFHELAAAGLTPLEILQMATTNPAEFLGRQATMGSVDEGKLANLVLLDANPIADVANLDKISAVVLKGKYLSKDALAKMVSDTAATYKTSAASAFAIPAAEAAHTD